MRINALTRAYEQEFAKYGIPFRVYGGFRFYERKEVKDLLAYLRIISNPFDSEAVTRVVNVPKRGIGARTVEVLEDYARENDLSVYNAVLDADLLPLNAGSRAKVKAFGALLKSLVIKGAQESADELIRDVITDTGILAMYDDDSDESINKKANIDEFVNSVDEFCRMNKGATLADFLNQVTLSSDTDDINENDCVTVATIHSVKGLEFDNVFIVGMEENIMPVSRAAYDDGELEEERRLLYVAITRAAQAAVADPLAQPLPLRRAQHDAALALYRRACKGAGRGGDRAPVLLRGQLRRLRQGARLRRVRRRRRRRRLPKAPLLPPADERGRLLQRPAARGERARRRLRVEVFRRGGIPRECRAARGRGVRREGLRRLSRRRARAASQVRRRHDRLHKGEGKSLVANVSFPGVGIKALSVLIAPLTIL